MTVVDEELVHNAVKNTFVSSFAISLTLLVARLRDVISSANMVVGVDLSLSLWTAGMYALAIRIRYHEVKITPTHGTGRGWFAAYIAGISICSCLVLAGWIWGEILPDLGNGDTKLCNQDYTTGLRLSPGGSIVTAMKVGLSILAIICALLPKWKRKPELWKWLSVVLVLIDLIALITMIEIISNIVFRFKVEDLGLGQIIALCLLVDELFEIVKLKYRKSSYARV